MSERTTEPEIIVIGAGIAGLATSIALQRDVHQVLTLERRDKPGGLCGTAVLDGYEFAIGCNDFGSLFEKTMRELGVAVTFAHPRSIIHTDKAKYVLPPTPTTAFTLLRHLPDVVRVARALRAAKKHHRYTFLSEILDHVTSRDLTDFLCVTSFGFGSPPSEFPIETLLSLFSQEFAYGYDHPVTPIGGPAVLTERMAQRLVDLGGVLKLGTEAHQVDSGGPVKTVHTADRTYQARYVVSSQNRHDLYPAGTKPSLALAALHLAVPRDAPFPDGVHTVLDIPADAPRWLDQLDNGEQPTEFGFNIFPCEFLDSREYRSFTAFLLLPRGTETFTPSQEKHIEDYVLDRLTVRLPGLTSRLLYQRLIAPREYRDLHDLSSEVVPAVPPAGFRKPDNHDPHEDLFYIGNSVQPPGEHAGSALLSGLRTATAIHDRITTSP